MKKYFSNKIKTSALAFVLTCSGIFTTGCTEDIDKSNRYTFTGETIADYLQNRPEEYSHLCTILKKARIGRSSSGNMLHALSTYGSYTIFAPDNKAIEAYLTEEYERWLNSLGGDEENIIYTGIYSPDVEELSDSMCTEIAKNHIIERGRKLDNLTEGVISETTFSNRFIHMNDSVAGEGRKEKYLTFDRQNYVKVNEVDIEVENGTIQTMAGVLVPSNEKILQIIERCPELKIFSAALKATGLSDSLEIRTIDPDYDGELYGTVDMGTGALRGAKAPEDRLRKYTLLIEPDEVFIQNNINNIDDLRIFANKWYGEEYEKRGLPVDYDDETSRNNPLNRFVAYHILDRAVNAGCGYGAFLMHNNQTYKSNFNAKTMFPETFDRTDYFETMLPYTLIKVTCPTNNGTINPEVIVLNRSQEKGTKSNNPAMEPYKDVNVYYNTPEELGSLVRTCDFGTIHPIDKILVYNEDEMASNILYERMRWDSSSLFPELTNNNVRWSPGFMNNGVEKHGCYIPAGYCERLKIHNPMTKLFYLRPNSPITHTGWTCYQGDEFMIEGKSDISVRLPYVPAGTYEIRYGFSSEPTSRGITQFYFDKDITGIPVDMALITIDNTMQLYGIAAMGGVPQSISGQFTYDPQTRSEEEEDAHDKSMRNRGWMRGPASVIVNNNFEISGGSTMKISMRQSSVSFRRIVTTATINYIDENGKRYSKGHTLRCKNVTSTNGSNDRYDENSFDYLEMVPTSIISDPSNPEDKY